MTKYTITLVAGTMCPNQLHGVTDEGQHFYFRGRGGRWQLHFGATEDESITGPGYEGELEAAGWLEKEEWEAFFWEVVEQINNGTATALDLQRHAEDMSALLGRLMTPATPEQIEEALGVLKGGQND